MNSSCGLTLEDWQAVWLSVRVSALAVFLSLPAGIALGWLLARKSFRGKALLETLVNLPLVMPPVVTGLLLLYLFGKRGWIGHWLFATFGIEDRAGLAGCGAGRGGDGLSIDGSRHPDRVCRLRYATVPGCSIVGCPAVGRVCQR